jgi:hypothetical protein
VTVQHVPRRPRGPGRATRWPAAYGQKWPEWGHAVIPVPPRGLY